MNPSAIWPARVADFVPPAAMYTSGRSSGPWARVIPTELPIRDGLTISRGSPVPAARRPEAP